MDGTQSRVMCIMQYCVTIMPRREDDYLTNDTYICTILQQPCRNGYVGDDEEEEESS